MEYTQQEISNFNLIKAALLSRRGIYYDKDKITDLLTQTPRVCLMQYTDEGDKYILFGLLRTSDWQHYSDYVLGRKLVRIDSNISLQLVQLRACTGAISIFDYGIGNKYKPEFDYDIFCLSLNQENQFEDNELEIYREAFIDALTLDMENDIEDLTPLVRFVRNVRFYLASHRGEYLESDWGAFGIEELNHLVIVMQGFHGFLERNNGDIIKRLQRRQGTGPNTTIYNMVTNLEELKNVIANRLRRNVIANRSRRQIDSVDGIANLNSLEELTDLSLKIIKEKTGPGSDEEDEWTEMSLLNEAQNTAWEFDIQEEYKTLISTHRTSEEKKKERWDENHDQNTYTDMTLFHSSLGKDPPDTFDLSEGRVFFSTDSGFMSELMEDENWREKEYKVNSLRLIRLEDGYWRENAELDLGVSFDEHIFPNVDGFICKRLQDQRGDAMNDWEEAVAEVCIYPHALPKVMAKNAPKPQFYDTLISGVDMRVVALGTEYTIGQFKRLGKFFIEKKLVYDNFDNNEIDAGCSLTELMANIAYPVLVNPGSFEQVYCIQDIMGWINAGNTTDPNTRQEITKIRVMNEQDIEKKELQNFTKEKNQIEDKINQLRSEPGNMQKIRTLEYKKRMLDESIRKQKEEKVRRETKRLGLGTERSAKKRRLKFKLQRIELKF